MANWRKSLIDSPAVTAYPQPETALTKDGRGIFYFANMCHVCRKFGEEVKLKRCGACSIIVYCGTEHQKEDWPSHRDFCKAIVKIKKDWNLVHVFQPLKCTNISADKTVSEIMNESKSRVDFKVSLWEKLEQVLERSIHKHEKEMIWFPRVCAVCFECKPELLTNCKKCPQTSFCTKHLNDPRHQEICPKILISYLSEMVIQTKYEKFGKALRRSKVPVHQKAVKLSGNMKNFLDDYFSETLKVWYSEEAVVPRIIDAFASEVFSRPLSLLFAMEKLNLTSRSKIRVHVIGSNMQELVLNDWESILHFLPQMSELELVFIGPDIIVGFPFVGMLNQVCKLCEKKKRKLIIKMEKSTYQDYFYKVDFRVPDIIAGFNCNFYAYQSWDRGVDILGKVNRPFVLTANNEIEGYNERQIVASKFSSANCVFFQSNPYSTLSYFRDHQNETISCSNGFMLLYKDFGPCKS